MKLGKLKYFAVRGHLVVKAATSVSEISIVKHAMGEKL